MATKIKKTTITTENKTGFFDRIQGDLEKNNSLLNIILGGLIVIVVGILVYNFFTNRPQDNLGPAQQVAQTTETPVPTGDVAKENLPGSYTVKEGDTLFTIAQSYYGDGYQYQEIADANNMADVNALEVGQVITIPS